MQKKNLSQKSERKTVQRSVRRVEKDVKIEVNEKVWDKISFEKKGIKMKQQEEIPYAEGSDTDKSDQE